MCHILLAIALFSGPVELERTFVLGSKGQFFNRLGRAEIQGDGSIMVPNLHQIFHFDNNGKLINSFGRKGEGPGEFVLAYKAYWTGDCYLAVDNRRRDLSIFNAKAEFVRRESLEMMKFFPVKGRFFMVDTFEVINDRPPVSEFVISDSYSIEKQGAPFHFANDRTKSYRYDYSEIYLGYTDDKLLLADQLTRVVTTYNLNLKKLGSFKAELKGYIDPPEEWDPNISRKELILKYCSFTRIWGMATLNSGLVFHYNIPNPESPDKETRYLGFTDLSGKSLTEPWVVEGHFLGVWNDRIYTVKENEDISYVVNVYRLRK